MMIRVWHVLPVLSLLTSLGVGAAFAKLAGGGLRNYAVGVSLGCGVGLLCGAIAWLFGRAALRRGADRDPLDISTGALFGQLAIAIGSMIFSVFVAVLAMKVVF